MKKYTRLKSMGSFLMILILLPYIFTVFFHGVDRENRISDTVYVKVETVQAGTEGKEKTLTEVPLKEYFFGVLALETPENSEPELLKAQAVLTRTKLWQQKDGGGDVVFTERYLSAEELRKYWGKEKYENSTNNWIKQCGRRRIKCCFMGKLMHGRLFISQAMG